MSAVADDSGGVNDTVQDAAGHGDQPTETVSDQDRDALHAEARRLLRQGRLKDAIPRYQRLVDDDAQDSTAWANLGLALRAKGDFEAALACQRRALEIVPTRLTYHLNLGNVLKDLDRFDEALTLFERLAAAAPNNAKVHHNHATVLKEIGDLDAALAAFQRACALDPDLTESQWGAAVVLLTQGSYQEGWPFYDARLRLARARSATYAVPAWRGEDLAGEMLLVHPEQGLGDAILAARFLPLVKARGGALVLSCRAPLLSLFQDAAVADRVIAADDDLPAFDLHCALMSLPVIFDTHRAAVPPPLPLSPTAASRGRYRETVARYDDRFKVGIVWSGSTGYKDNHRRATALQPFLRLCEVPGVQLFSLQKGAQTAQIRRGGAEALVVDLGSRDRDLADTAAAIEDLDLVIMTDSAVAHLAGSMGRPVWNLLHHVPYWIYGVSGETTPWYPSMRLFRQPGVGDWDSVFERVLAELRTAVAMKQAGQWPG